MNILVIHTGGTVGSVLNGGVISPDTRKSETDNLINDNDYKFDDIYLTNILSENADDSFYEALINYINSADLSKYQGIIIMHGTDTLSYTASLVAMALRHIEIPVCFVSANYVLSDERSNGLDNLRTAVGYITSGGKGFVVPYKNADGRMLIHLATRIQEADFATGSFNSIGFSPLAELIKSSIVYYSNCGISQDNLSESKEKIISKDLKLNNKILLIRPYPEINYDIINIDKLKFNAVLHTGYHTGAADSTRLCEFIRKCKDNGVDFYHAPITRSNEQYKTTQEILSAGAEAMYSMTVESALAKLKLKYNLKNIDLNKELYFEEYRGVNYEGN